jgi:tetratricopeptide (TPR) repeat protein
MLFKRTCLAYGVFCFLSLAIRAQDFAVDSLKKLLTTPLNDTTRCHVLDQLIEIAPEGEWQNYNENLKQLTIKNLSRKPNGYLFRFFSKYYATAVHNEGIMYFEQSDDEKAIDCFNKSITVSRQSGNRNQMAISLQAIAQINIRKGQNTKALSELYQSLKIFEEVRDEIGIADVHLSLGDICFFQKDYKKALEHHKKSYDLYSRNDYLVAISAVCYKVGLDYYELKDYPMALFYQQKSIDIIEKADLSPNSVTYLNIAQIYVIQKKFDKATEYAQKALKISQASQNKAGICQGHVVLSKLFMNEKKYAQAAEHGEKALVMAKEIDHASEISLAAKQLYEVYTLTKQEAKAAKMHELYLEAKSNLDNQESKNALLEQKLRYEYEQKELISRTENEKKLVTLKSKSDRDNLVKNIWLMASAVIVIFIGLSAWFLYRNFKQKNIISLQKTNLLKQKLLVSQMNPHFIFNSLNAIQNYIFKQDSLKAGNYLTQFSELIRMILDFSRKDYIAVESELKLLHTYLDLQKLRFENKFDYAIVIDKTIDTEFTFIPPMLAQPFIENAIEHGIYHKREKGQLEIRLFYEENRLIYEIEDNGIGIEEAMKIKNKLRSSYQSLATIITKERMTILGEQHKTPQDIEIIDKKNNPEGGSGVKVRFSIPHKHD